MATEIEVRVQSKGVVLGDRTRPEPELVVTCEVCGDEVDCAASLGAPGGEPIYACATCLRERLEAMSIARWQFREVSASGLPWGKVAG